MKCKNPGCAKDVDSNWKNCPFCGTELSTKPLCPGCANALDPAWKLCPFCGAAAEGQGPAASAGTGKFCQGCGTLVNDTIFKCDNCQGVFCLDCRVNHPDGKLLPLCASCGHDMVQALRKKRAQEAEAKRQAEEARRREEESRKQAAAEEKRRQAQEEQRRREEARRSLGIIPDPQGRPIEWYVGPDRDINWNDACTWVKNLTADGGGWRMPTIKELKGLYENGRGESNMAPDFGEFSCGAPYVWSGETYDSSSAWVFYFYDGEEYWDDRTSSGSRRVFAVRSRG